MIVIKRGHYDSPAFATPRVFARMVHGKKALCMRLEFAGPRHGGMDAYKLKLWNPNVPAKKRAVVTCELFEDLVLEEDIRCEWQRSGALYLFRDERAFHHFKVMDEAVRKYSAGCLAISPIELKEREPSVRSSVAGAWLDPGAAWLRPAACLYAWLSASLLVRIRIFVPIRSRTVDPGSEICSLASAFPSSIQA